jgi:hypothetical protein
MDEALATTENSDFTENSSCAANSGCCQAGDDF